jgi:hypothetical protein
MRSRRDRRREPNRLAAAGLDYSKGRKRELYKHIGIRVIYVHAIKKVASYVYAMKKFPSTCMRRTRSSLTYMPFWMDGELTEVLEVV